VSISSSSVRRLTDVAYDQDLANRVREQLAEEDSVTEKEMFGGIAFMLAGNMSVGVSGDELMVRVGPQGADEALEQPHARPFDMTGRPMRGWVLVAAEGVRSDRGLAEWVERGVGFARSLPPKG
jgi:TfoX/Sxy family transcriptional regulator of competence genes